MVRLAEEMGIRGRVKILVGGAPISQSFCDEIGADAYTEDAASAAREAGRPCSAEGSKGMKKYLPSLALLAVFETVAGGAVAHQGQPVLPL